MIDIIAEAIRKKQRLNVSYPPGDRLVEPHALGRGSNGQFLLRAYQVAGASESGEHENWKLFRLDRMESSSQSTEFFDEPRPEYNPDDKAMKGGFIERLPGNKRRRN